VQKRTPKAHAGGSLIGLQEKAYAPMGGAFLPAGVDFAILCSS
jgi:hypothetical protein